MKLELTLFNQPGAAGMDRVNDRHRIGLRHGVDRTHQAGEILRIVNIFFPVGGEHDIPFFLQPKVLQHCAALDFILMGLDNFPHRRACDENMLPAYSLGNQIAPGVLCIGQVDVRDMIHNAPVGLLREIFVKTAVARLHMKNRDFQTLGRNRRQCGVGVSQNQQRVRLPLLHQTIGFGDNISYRLSQAAACHV